MDDIYFMSEAIALAEQAHRMGEVPVGAVLVADGKIIARGHNQVITQNDPSAHAEVVALRDAGHAQKNYRFPQTTLYVTLEPCCMCSGALFHARVAMVVYGAKDEKTGCAGSCLDLFTHQKINHHTQVRGGVCQAACGRLLQRFFEEKRK